MSKYRLFLALALVFLLVGTTVALWPWSEVTEVQPDGTISLDMLLAEAHTLAKNHLETVGSSQHLWLNMGEWLSEIGFSGGIWDPNTPVLVVTFQGKGSWTGASGGIRGSMPIEGITFALDGRDGTVITTIGGYGLPSRQNENVYKQYLNRPTVTPIEPLLSSPDIQSLPTPENP